MQFLGIACTQTDMSIIVKGQTNSLKRPLDDAANTETFVFRRLRQLGRVACTVKISAAQWLLALCA
jgi:hypothetical protein